MPPLPLSVRLSALNSNLILLIRYSVYAFRLQVIVFKFQSDSINTTRSNETVAGASPFKFQSDSINTGRDCACGCGD